MRLQIVSKLPPSFYLEEGLCQPEEASRLDLSKTCSTGWLITMVYSKCISLPSLLLLVY
jgi:hypothetical protein